MAKNPLRKTDRASQIKKEVGDISPSIKLYDVDYAIINYLQDVLLPPIDEDGKYIKIPVIYGNSEKWNSAKKEGIYRDQKGRIQLPLMMIRRSAVAKNQDIAMLNRHLYFQSIRAFVKDNRYDRFNLLTGLSPKYKVYNITMPDFVEITYQGMGWTNYSEHLNEIIESLNWASEEYWGDKNQYKFYTTVSDYNIINETTPDNERINRVEFNLNVKAYLLPEKFDGEKTTKKGFTSRAVIITSETDLTAEGRIEASLSNPSVYNANKDIVDYLAISTPSDEQTVSGGQVQFTGIKLIKPPAGISSVISGGMTVGLVQYDIKVYNGNTIVSTYTASFSNGTLTISGMTGVNDGDSIKIIGKFINV